MKSKLINKTCDYCNGLMKVYPSTLRIGRGKHCSIKCSSDSQLKHTPRNCIICGKEFRLYPANPTNVSCSHSCRMILNKNKRNLLTEKEKENLKSERVEKAKSNKKQWNLNWNRKATKEDKRIFIQKKREQGSLTNAFGTCNIPNEIKIMWAIKQTYKRNLTKQILTKIQQGETYEAYI